MVILDALILHGNNLKNLPSKDNIKVLQKCRLDTNLHNSICNDPELNHLIVYLTKQGEFVEFLVPEKIVH